jgi:uncharacterized MAPEG superfamily protein
MSPVSSIPYLSLLVTALLIFLPRGVVAREQARQPEGYDSSTPRLQVAKLSGLGQRAQGAHLNSFEALTLFAPAVLACELRHVDLGRTSALCLAFVALRIVYLALYLGDKPTLRSSVWTLGVLATLALYVLAIVGT